MASQGEEQHVPERTEQEQEEEKIDRDNYGLCKDQPYGMEITNIDQEWIRKILNKTPSKEWWRLESEGLVIRNPKTPGSVAGALRPSKFLKPKAGLPVWLQAEVSRFMFRRKITTKNKSDQGTGSPAVYQEFFTQTLQWPNLEELPPGVDNDRKRMFFLLLQHKVYNRIANVRTKARGAGLMKPIGPGFEWYDSRLKEIWDMPDFNGKVEPIDSKEMGELPYKDTYAAHLEYFTNNGAKAYKKEYVQAEDDERVNNEQTNDARTDGEQINGAGTHSTTGENDDRDRSNAADTETQLDGSSSTEPQPPQPPTAHRERATRKRKTGAVYKAFNASETGLNKALAFDTLEPPPRYSKRGRT